MKLKKIILESVLSPEDWFDLCGISEEDQSNYIVEPSDDGLFDICKMAETKNVLKYTFPPVDGFESVQYQNISEPHLQSFLLIETVTIVEWVGQPVPMDGIKFLFENKWYIEEN